MITCICNSLAEFLIHVMLTEKGIRHIFNTCDMSHVEIVVNCFDEVPDYINYKLRIYQQKRKKVQFEFYYC